MRARRPSPPSPHPSSRPAHLFPATPLRLHHHTLPPPPSPAAKRLRCQLGLIPCDPETCDFLYRMGQLDAMAWAEGTGIAQAAAAKMRAARATVEGAAKPWAAAPAGGDGGAAEGDEGARVIQG